MTRIRRLLHLLMAVAAAVAAGACHGGGSPTAIYPDPARYEIRGIDISAHNGEVDFDRVRREGYEFVLVKASEGGNFRDKRFVANYTGARSAGLKVGAYHFFRFDVSGYLQGLNFADALEGRAPDLPAVIDIEEWTNPNQQATPLVLSRLNEMIDLLEARGHRVMLYTNKNGLARFIRPLPRALPLWICSLGTEPDDTTWTLWQATHSGQVPGVTGPVDVNAFKGTRAQWERFITTGRPRFNNEVQKASF